MRKIRLIKNCKDLNRKLLKGNEYEVIKETKEQYTFEIEKRLYCNINKSCVEVVEQ